MLYKKRNWTALAFLAPNFIGFLIFTSIPVVAAFGLALFEWDIFNPPKFVGLRNFVDLLGWHVADDGKRHINDPVFWKYLWNTIFFMLAIPINIFGSMFLAIVLNQKMRGRVIFRVIFFVPSVCSGVGIMLLWKWLYNPEFGLINTALAPVYKLLSSTVNALPASLVSFGFWPCLLLMFVIFVWSLRRLSLMLHEGELGLRSIIVCLIFLCLPWLYVFPPVVVLIFLILIVAVQAFSKKRSDRLRTSEGAGRALLLSLGMSAVQFTLLGIGVLLLHLPQWAADGFELPKWLNSYHMAKPAIMLMGFWGGIGGTTMILYLAGLQGIDPQLYDAADVDGANAWEKFVHITYPMLMPTTFFIFITSVIGGFQGGFEAAYIMTGGGPEGTTTTIVYYIYNHAFVWFNMGYAAAIAIVLFAIVLLATIVNWKYGGKKVQYV